MKYIIILLLLALPTISKAQSKDSLAGVHIKHSVTGNIASGILIGLGSLCYASGVKTDLSGSGDGSIGKLFGVLLLGAGVYLEGWSINQLYQAGKVLSSK